MTLEDYKGWTVSPQYKMYLRSDTWQRLRTMRLKIDKFTCQMCGSKFHLQVHHTRYVNPLGSEDPYTDLITLCDLCHEDIETGKREQREEKRRQIEEAQKQWESDKEKREKEREEQRKRRKHHQDLIRQFIEEHRKDDISNLGEGSLNYCNLDVVKSAFYPWMRAHGAEEFDDGYIAGVSQVQDYFRNRKYEVILAMMAQGLSEWQVQEKTGFTESMIHKVFNNPTQAKTLLNREREENEHV